MGKRERKRDFPPFPVRGATVRPPGAGKRGAGVTATVLTVAPVPRLAARAAAAALRVLLREVRVVGAGAVTGVPAAAAAAPGGGKAAGVAAAGVAAAGTPAAGVAAAAAPPTRPALASFSASRRYILSARPGLTRRIASSTSLSFFVALT